MAGPERLGGADVDQHRPVVNLAPDLLDRQRREGAVVLGEDPRAALVDRSQPQEVRGEAAQPAEQPLGERLLVGGGQQQVVGPFGADGGGPLGVTRGRAERPGPVGGVDPQVVGQGL